MNSPILLFFRISALLLALTLLWPAPAAWAQKPSANPQGGEDLLSILWPGGYPPATPADKRAGIANNTSPLDPHILSAHSQRSQAAGTARPEAVGTIRRVQLPEGVKAVALTYDTCELQSSVSGFDLDLVQTLRQEGAHATFFAGGKWLRSHRERGLQLMATPGFELANHAWTHGNFGIMSLDHARQQALWPEALYADLRQELTARATAAGHPELMAAVPERQQLFRLPYGRCRPETLQLLADLGLQVVQWDLIGELQKDNSPPAVAHKVAAQVRPGSIILMHANLVPTGTAALTAQLIPLLHAQGYTLLNVSELLRLGTPLRVQEGYFSHPGDNLSLDSLFGIDGTGVKR